VSSIDIGAFFSLTQIIKEGSSQDRRVFKAANDKLTQFSKTNEAWSVSLDVLNAQPTNEFTLFQAESILKNKIMFDFVALRQANGTNHEQVTLQLRSTLLQIISRLTQPETLAPAFILNTLSIAMAYLIIHTH
jgi:hypothetical protein